MGKFSTFVVIIILLGAGGWYLNYHLKLSNYDQELLFNDEKTVQGVVYYTSDVIPAGTYRIEIDTEGSVNDVEILDANSGNVIHTPLMVVKSDFIYTSDVPFRVRVEFHPEGDSYIKYRTSVKVYRLTKKEK
jgi:hypothetical protein